jgi:hypothetical protein
MAMFQSGCQTEVSASEFHFLKLVKRHTARYTARENDHAYIALETKLMKTIEA